MYLATIDPPTDQSPRPPADDSPEAGVRMPAELLRWAAIAVREARRRALEEMLADRA